MLEAVVAKKFVAVAFVKIPLVPMRFVVVTVPKLPFQRSDAVPRANVRSVVGRRFEDTVPDTVRLEVTVTLFAMAPPRRLNVAVALEPRFVTESKVSASVG